MSDQTSPDEFSSDLAFLRRYVDIRILTAPDGDARIAVSPDLQGRVMTSTTGKAGGPSFGWINRTLFQSGDTLPHMNAFGGEERFWLGPEGGQYSIFFKENDPFDLEHWQTPRLIDLDHYPVIEQHANKIIFRKTANLTNYSGYNFDFKIDRTIEILPKETIQSNLGFSSMPELSMVGYRTINQLTNTGPEDWMPENGLLSIWLLGMYNPSESTVVLLPYHQGPEEELGPVVNDTYFGKVPADRLVVKNGIIYFRGDGKYRSKIGLNPQRANDICGAYDALNHALTLVRYNKPDTTDRYVNSLWELQKDPYGGDVINSYNDGPSAPGATPLGPFFELETSSPALALKSGETGTHLQETYHFSGPESVLDPLMRRFFGITIEEARSIF